ncbi:hypothetical protein GCK32_004044 [Trichostrongylus colubriformis]|uniref:Uncharacterized protein n=1 Tax=Trichostrongylus colubriformis TaxID=6319 RepID=A0AAN8IS70_TRICO
MKGMKMDENTKILGISWNDISDQFTIKLPTLPDPDITWTKRQVLKFVAKTSDPLVSVEGEARMGRSSTTKSSEDLEGHHIKLGYDKHQNRAKTAERYKVDIYIRSPCVYGCFEAYLVEINENRNFSLVMSKTRLAPLKFLLTIPRLELSAINLG